MTNKSNGDYAAGRTAKELWLDFQQ